jgi:hypothetical protein
MAVTPASNKMSLRTIETHEHKARIVDLNDNWMVDWRNRHFGSRFN